MLEYSIINCKKRFKVGGLFTFPEGLLIKNLKRIVGNQKKNPLIPKSSRPMYNSNRLINKGDKGLKFANYQDILPSQLRYDWHSDVEEYPVEINIPNTLEEELSQNYKSIDEILQETRERTLVTARPPELLPLPDKPKEHVVETPKKPTENYDKYTGYKTFSKAFDAVVKEMPEAAKYRELLTKIADHESKFNMSILNKSGAPAYGYFLFWQDGKTNNITAFSDLSLEEFRKNPKEQIKAAVKMALKVEKSFTNEDKLKALNMGISLSGMIGGAWLGGVGGVRKVLNGTGNPSDNHWNKNGKGSNVAECMQRYNNLI